MFARKCLFVLCVLTFPWHCDTKNSAAQPRLPASCTHRNDFRARSSHSLIPYLFPAFVRWSSSPLCLSPPSLSLGRERRAKSTLGTRKTHPLYIRPDFTSGGGAAAASAADAGAGGPGASCVSFERHAIAAGRMNGVVMHTCITS